MLVMRGVQIDRFWQKVARTAPFQGLDTVAAFLRLGVTKSVISAYETALRYPSYDILIRIASLFGVSVDYLLGIEAVRTLDISGLSNEHVELVRRLVDALRT